MCFLCVFLNLALLLLYGLRYVKLFIKRIWMNEWMNEYDNLRWGNAMSHKVEVGERRSLASLYSVTTAYTRTLQGFHKTDRDSCIISGSYRMCGHSTFFDDFCTQTLSALRWLATMCRLADGQRGHISYRRPALWIRSRRQGLRRRLASDILHLR